MLRLSLAVSLVLLLAACESSEERAERHYQSALALLAENDLERASVEFRNVFRLDGLHVEARRSYATALREAGNVEQAYSQFLRLAEQLPDDPDTRRALAEMAIENESWAQLQVHGSRLLELVPPEMRAGEEGQSIAIISTTLDYATAIQEENSAARIAAAQQARELLEGAPGNLGLYRVLVDDSIRNGDEEAALGFVDGALAASPDNRDLHNTRLRLLAQLNDAPGLRAQLEDMIERFPDDTELVSTLLRFHVSRGDNEAAETFLRERLAAATDPKEARDLRGTLVQFIVNTKGVDAALAEIEGQIAATGGNTQMRVMQATIRFATGEREAAISELSELLARAAENPADEIDSAEIIELNNAKVVLAGMFVEEGNPVGARRLVGEVLESDPTQSTAVHLEAGWLIEDDRSDDAIALLRRALDVEPDNVNSMTLMARAHNRNGNHELARDFLALAYETSNAAPGETLRYSADLLSEERFLAAEEALIRALRLEPRNLDILTQLARVYVAMEDWPRTEDVERTARRLGTEAGNALAVGLRVARLNAGGQTEDALGFLKELADNAEGRAGRTAQLAIINAYVEEGQTDEAMAYLQDVLVEAPDDIVLLMARGAVERASGDIDSAIATYNGLTEQAPTFERAWTELIRAKFASGDVEGAKKTLDAALTTLPDAANLLWAQASFLEQSGDVAGAIAIYETLYENMPNSSVVANNLASLISTYRTDDESLERAYAVARRLRGTEVPQMMDTYGWISFRRGEVDEARPYLEGAAAALTRDPLVQFHYGMLLSAAGETEAAIAQLNLALAIAGSSDTRPQFDIAREEIAKLEAMATEAESVSGE